jgi:hypothetical protein
MIVKAAARMVYRVLVLQGWWWQVKVNLRDVNTISRGPLVRAVETYH